ncbi:MAG: hypothetical protein Q8L45_09510 [Xanthomonadaceae bacterium]|nr:hypothetical protein [Xanthomonadaceae bacterium]MDP2186950.1 hypothetical protein [Xanthomonadales bacterium]MDZ4116725.1 hypothetical protein [Xanthomonadaceae bacterium]MDZ4379409.1 hypothetical protein [Xanthomonadaceae bacterium]
MSDLQSVIAALLAGVLVISSARLIAQAVRTPASGFRQPRAWRVAALIALHALSATLLWLALFPPLQSRPDAELAVLTAGANADIHAAEPAVALPEAPQGIAVERVPDLATALRRHGNIRQLHVIGNGLSARDRDAARGLDLRFSASAMPTGLIELAPPHWPRAGQNWQLRGRVNGGTDTKAMLTKAMLLAPDDSVIDRITIDAQGRFVLNAQARSPGQAIFQLRLLDADNHVRETHAVPVATRSGDPLRVALRAGGTNAELKYLRRWIRDAGLQLRSDLRISPVVNLRDQASDLSAAALANIDVLLLDDRAWYSLGSDERSVVLNAVHAGLGVLVLLSDEPDRNQQQQLAALGFAVNSADVSRTIRLRRQQPVNSIDSTNNATPQKQQELSRRTLRVEADAARPLLHADDGEALALWHAAGRGRVALWWLTDSFRLVLSGAANEHANLWRDALSVIARPGAIPAPRFTPDNGHVGIQTLVCASAEMRVLTPDERIVALLAHDNNHGQRCAGFWPQSAGWHVLQSSDQAWPFYVHERNAYTAMQAWREQLGTARLATYPGASQPQQASATIRASPFPYALAWLLSLAALWLFERLRIGH